MSRYIDLSKITVPKATLSEDSQKFHGQEINYFERALSDYKGDADTQNLINPTILVGGGEDNWAFYKTIHYQSVGAGNKRRFQIAYPGGTGVDRIKWRFTNTGTLPMSWHVLAEKSDLDSLVSLSDMEKIISLETKEERLMAISEIRTARIIENNKIETDMSKNDTIRGGELEFSSLEEMARFIASVSQPLTEEKGGQHEPICRHFKVLVKMFCLPRQPNRFYRQHKNIWNLQAFHITGNRRLPGRTEHRRIYVDLYDFRNGGATDPNPGSLSKNVCQDYLRSGLAGIFRDTDEGIVSDCRKEVAA